MGVVDDVDSELVGGLPDFAFDAGVAVGPGVADIAWMVVGDESSVNDPARALDRPCGATMGSLGRV